MACPMKIASLALAVLMCVNAEEITRTKRCSGPFDDSCSNGGVAGSGVDGDCFSNPSACSPGKRDVGRRCAVGVLDENCDNGDIPDSGVDGDCFSNPSNCSPGKRALIYSRLQGLPFRRLRQHLRPRHPLRPQRRCVSIFDDNCVNGQLIGAGDDGYYFQGSNTPGK